MDDEPYVRAYLSGYADGEGCFCVTFNRSGRHRFGWEVRPSFSVSQNADRAEVLGLYQKVLQCGFIRPDRSDKTLKYEVRGIGDLATKVLPHFEQYPLLSNKRKDYEVFAAIVRSMHNGEHQQPEGFMQIVVCAEALNASSRKRFARREIGIEQIKV